jgi:Tat protein translocase TatB subunit
MFDIGFGEMLLLAAIALIALGPKQLPEVARTLGRFMNQVKRATGEFQRTLAEVSDTTNKHFDDAKSKLESHIIPPNYIGSPATPNTEHQTGHETIQAQVDDIQQSLPMNGVDPHAGGRHGLESAAGADDSGDEHQQMSFDIDKKES